MGRPGDYVIVVIHSVCEQDYWKKWVRIPDEPISVKIGAVIGPIYRKNWLAFGGASVPGECGFQITCPFSSPMRKGILEDLLAFLIHYRQFFFTKHGETTDVDKVMNPQHFGSDPADIRIRIPGHFWLTFRRWRRFALSEHCVFIHTIWHL